MENSETASAGHGVTDGKKALYHCNYCNKDISGKIRIKCAVCSDFDLCVECFSVGAEVHPHKSNHPYRVMDNLSFPLICPDWNADEEILLLEGIEMYGLGNWTEVAEHVGTKSKSLCIDHYNTIYMNSTCFPLPDMSHVMGKNREELLAMAKERGEIKKGFSTPGEVNVKEESLFSARIKVEDQNKDSPAERSSPNIASEGGFRAGGGNALIGGSKRASNIIQSKDSRDGIKMEDRSVGEKKLRTSNDESPAVKEISGYNSKRQEFEVEYDNDAETLLADMEFKEADTDAERELKLRVLRIYAKRLDERKRRKDFILERNLLYPDPFEKELTQEEKDLCNNYKVYMRFHSKEEHEGLLRTLVEEHRVLKRIQYLQEALAAGCLTSADAEKFIEQKLKREAEENSYRLKDGPQVSSSGKYLQRVNHLKGDPDSSPRGSIRGPTVLDSGGLESPSAPFGHAVSNVLDDWDVTGFLGAELLSDAEKRLCREIRILPTHYLNMLETISVGIFTGTITNKSDAYGMFNVDPSKVDKVYDMLEQKGVAKT